MTDYELLAAVAGDDPELLGAEYYDGPDPRYVGFFLIDKQRYWNPFTDDGDALRLAVKRAIDISQDPNSRFVCASATDGAYIVEAYGDDPAAATRRAVVRAAIAQKGTP